MTIIRISQHSSGIEDYLENGIKQGREERRDELDVRVPIIGNLDILQNTNNYARKHKNWKSNYWHITISMPWKYHLTSDSTNRAITLDVIDYYFHLYDKKQLAVYAEIHKPKQQRAIDPITLEKKQRLPHIHLIVSKLDLWSNNQLRILPYKKHVAESFQIWLDDKYNMESHYLRMQEAGKAGSIDNAIPTVAEAEIAIFNYKNWHGSYNARKPNKQLYAPVKFMKIANWKKFAKPDEQTLKQLRQISNTLTNTHWINHQLPPLLLQSSDTAIQALRKRLIDMRTKKEHKDVINKIIRQYNVRSILTFAANQYGLDRKSFSYETINKINYAKDHRTGHLFNAVELAYKHLNMTVFESIAWLIGDSPVKKWARDFLEEKETELLTKTLLEYVAEDISIGMRYK